MNSYRLGSVVHLSTRVTVGGVLTDPTAMTLVITKPDGTTVTPTPVHDGTGLYSYDYTPTVAGTFTATWTATGTAAGVDVDTFEVYATTNLDVLTLAEAKLALPSSAGTANDDLLGAYVTGVSRYLDSKCGPVVIRTVTDELQDGGYCFVVLNHRPVSSVTTVTEYAGTVSTVLTAETPGTQPASGVLLDNARTGLLYRRRSGCDAAFAIGRRNIKVTYQAGRYASTDTVDSLFKRAASIILSNLWRPEHGLAAGVGIPVLGPTYAMPNAAAALLWNEMLGAPTG